MLSLKDIEKQCKKKKKRIHKCVHFSILATVDAQHNFAMDRGKISVFLYNYYNTKNCAIYTVWIHEMTSMLAFTKSSYSSLH